MESAAAISELNWNFDGSTFSDQHQFSTLTSAEEAEIMAQLFSGYQYTKEQSVAQGCDSFLRLNFSCSDQETMNMVVDGDSYFYYSENSHSNLHYWSQGNQLIPVSDFETIPGSGAVKDGVPFFMSTDFYMGDDGNACLEFHGVPNNNPVEEAVCQNEAMSSYESGEVHAILEQRFQCKRKMQLQENSQLEIAPIKRRKQDDLTNSNSEKAEQDYPSENPQKKTKLSGDGQRIRKNSQLNKNQKLTRTDEAEENMRLNGQSSSSYCSEDDSLSSQEHNGITSSCNKGSSPALNLNGKARTGRGSATDPQSLYARKRRERINERLRILQNLVPNGTKVDISTMLEEAVHYVKFLQLQIKLLSSDDMWMYAPIVCNGMDIGLDLKISPPS